MDRMKMTRQRKIVITLLKQSNQPVTAQELYRRTENINLSTIYRTLGVLTRNGSVLKHVEEDGTAYYQLNSPQHGHHLRCSICKQTILIDSCPVRKLAKQLEEKTGYHITGHTLEFTGVCADCRRETER